MEAIENTTEVKTMKSDIHLRLDVDVIELAKAKQINISDTVNIYLKQYLNIDETKAPKEKDLLIERRAELTAETNLVDAKLKSVKEVEDKKRKEELKAQEIEAAAVKRGDIMYT